MPMTARELMREAERARRRSYSPYSRFPVGAALLLADGTVVHGTNIENASYGLSVCAERNAVWKAVGEGRRDLVAIAVTAREGHGAPPCGSCRQVLNEFAPNLWVYWRDARGRIVRRTLTALLPKAFGHRDLLGEEEVSMEREKLIDLITRKVMEELKHGAAPASRAPAAAPAPIPRPPARPAPADHDPETCDRCRTFGVCAVQTPEETRVLAAAGASRVVSTLGYCPASDGLGSIIDHTLLKPEARREDIEQLCREAAQFCFASVCVNPNWVPLCRDMLRGSGVKVCTVVGFPLGAHLPDVKAYEARRAVEQGAEEVDMVINIGALKSKDYALVEQDIRGVVEAAGPRAMVKVILETSLLTHDEKIMGCTLAKAAGADYVKTSTGFSTGGATVEDVRLMRETVGPEIGVKASGGIRTKEDAEAMIQAGATRLGASAGVKIVRGETGDTKY